MNRRLTAGLAALGTLAALLASCGYDDTPLPKPPEAAPTSPPSKPPCTTTDADYRSYAPSSDVVAGGAVERIQKRGRLIVGVSADTYQMAAENPQNDNRIEGFDIEFAKAIGKAIFGSDFELGKNIQFKVITAGDRIGDLQNRVVDLVIRNFTVTCDRWQQIAFSQIYYEATQKVLVTPSLAEKYEGLQSLAGLRVCAPIGSTSLTNIQTQADKLGVDPSPILSPAVTHTGCLVKFQRGEVDAITGDDTVLAGLAAQDPYAVVPPSCDDPTIAPGTACQTSLEPEPYGIGANGDDIDLVRYVNAVLENMRNGAWQVAYNKYLATYLGSGATQPPPYLPYR
ncbi:transporter substrate-binding domain-containing protein [Nocardioides sp. MH1]|uniref:transporter substrate-binding domain-containing protein n=1 Tax=Nocardioides sp. MH1 TaxID=3242490 RepID=UPI0035229C12